MPQPTATIDLHAKARVHRIEVRPRPQQPDPLADQMLDQARAVFGMAVSIRSARLFLIEAPLDEEQVQRIADELLADPISQVAAIGVDNLPDYGCVVEVHYKPGVMDPVAQSTQAAIIEMLGSMSTEAVTVRTGYRYDIHGTDAPAEVVKRFARAALANPVIQDIYVEPYHPDRFAHLTPYELQVRHVAICDLDDHGLEALSRQGHLFLSLEEMRTIRAHYRQLPEQREPTDIELETLAQTWSEHCVHKTLKSTIRYSEADVKGASMPGFESAEAIESRPGHHYNADGSITIKNLLKSTIAAATQQLINEGGLKDWCISVFVDNAGIIGFDDTHGICVKVETHNHPSAIEPYGGAATGIGGVIRDIIGTGLAARPIANTNVFCVAPPDPPGPPDQKDDLPAGVIAPKRVLEQVVGGVRDYGNRMGIPTVNGAVWFHENYLGNPLVFCGCVGLIPLDKCFGDAQSGDRIIALGGRTGRDGIHGATFSSAELTDTHADEFSHAVQIGNAVTEKKTLDVILQARDFEGGPLFSAITDCGAGGFSSAVGEMAEHVGARVTLETAPLKYDGLSYTEIWISEAQERMVLSVPERSVAKLTALCQAEDVEIWDLGQFGDTNEEDQPQLTLTYQGKQVGQLAMPFLHGGLPTPTRSATWPPPAPAPGVVPAPGIIPRAQLTTAVDADEAPDLGRALKLLLAHPNIASKHWIIRQYDHEVQGASVVKPLVGPYQDGPGDAAVIRPKLDSERGIAISCGLQTGLGETPNSNAPPLPSQPGETSGGDSYWMTLGAIDEAVQNVVCVGARPDRIALLDNFCWPGCDDPAQLGTLVRAAEACYDGALAYRSPFISGKDSLNNQFTTEDGRVIAIPPTLLITAVGIVEDVQRCRTMDAKAAGNILIIAGATDTAMGGSHYLLTTAQQPGPPCDCRLPHVNLKTGPATATAVAALIQAGCIQSAHDCSEGGLLVAAAEMAFAGRIGLDLDLEGLPADQALDPVSACFAETPSRYLLEVAPGSFDKVVRALRDANIPFGQIGTFAEHDRLTVRDADQGQVLDESLDELRKAWRGTLDW